MLSKSLSVLLVVYLTSDFSFVTGQEYKHVRGLPGVYKFHATKMNWQDARRACAKEGARLFYPKDKNEVGAAISFWKLHETHYNPANIWMYLGISDIKTEGVFKTIDGKPVYKVYHGWYYPQPDNSGNEDCVHLNQKGELNDIRCDDQYSFMCEKKQPVSVATQKEYKHVRGLPGVYKFHATKKNWQDARRACAKEGARLFYPKDKNEVGAAISFWKLHETHYNPANIWMYLGISDIKTEGVFKTIDGKPVYKVYHGWYYPQPDNSGNEDCVHLNQKGELNDIRCDDQYSFMCEMK